MLENNHRWSHSFHLSVNAKSIEHCRGSGSIKASILHQLRQAKQHIERIRLNKAIRQTDEVVGIRSVNQTLCFCRKNGENVRIFFADRTLFQLSVISVCFYVLCYQKCLLNRMVNLKPSTCRLFGIWQFHIFHSLKTTRTILNSLFCVLINICVFTPHYGIQYSMCHATHKYEMFGSLSAYRRLLLL